MPDLDRALVKTQIKDFLGLNTNADPHDLKPGETVSQKNCAASVRGTLRTRSGLRFVDFSAGNGGTTSDVISAYPFQTPKADFIIYQRADGVILAGSDPA